MSLKTWVWLGLFVGSTLGALAPELWGGNIFSLASQVTAAIGGLLGIWAGFVIGKKSDG
ncbi:MAG TPA: hypothetical protein VLE93_00805 [Candidatus Saccharimonadales bacterium]|nr:hypothetical protein [Candidatus Saccharimonadales bacterium]